jgi:hypothetical protein
VPVQAETVAIDTPQGGDSARVEVVEVWLDDMTGGATSAPVRRGRGHCLGLGGM